jgi:hypothetical protein
LFSFAKNNNISIAIALQHEDLTHLLHLPLLETAFDQLQALAQSTDQMQLSTEQDIWRYTWGDTFSSSRAYKSIIGHSQHHPAITWI